MLSQLGVLAHNVIVWACLWPAPHNRSIASLVISRMVRDVFALGRFVATDPTGHIVQLVLNHRDPLANGLTSALLDLLAPERVSVILLVESRYARKHDRARFLTYNGSQMKHVGAVVSRIKDFCHIP